MKAYKIPHKPLLIIKSQYANKIRTLIPQAFVTTLYDKEVVIVRHTVRNSQLLLKLGCEGIWSPIYYEYKWSGRYNPFSHQKETASFLTLYPRSFVLSEIGTGKSLAALWAADYLKSKGIINRILIVSPLSTLERVWGDEIFQHFPHINFAVLHGTADKRRKMLSNADHDVYIINHDGIQIIEKELKDREDINLFIIDECPVYRNKTKRYASIHSIINKKPNAWVWMMTGTPIPNAPTDAYNQVRLIAPQKVPRYFSHFRDMVMKQVGPFRWVPREDALKIVYQAMQPAIRFTRNECLDLPPEIYSTRQCELTKEQHDAYEKMMKYLWMQLEKGEVTAVNEAVKMFKLLQIAGGVVYDTAGQYNYLDARHRINLVCELIEEAGEKVIVYAPLTGALSLIYNAIIKHWTCAYVDGSVSANKRNQIFKDFQNSPDPHVLVAHPKCMSHGLTLTEASTIIWYLPTVSPDTYVQANGRITRSGQTKTANIINIESTKIEQEVYRRLKSKEKMQGVLLNMIKKEVR